MKLLVAFLDDSGDGEIEASELESAMRQLRKDMVVSAEQEKGPAPAPAAQQTQAAKTGALPAVRRNHKKGRVKVFSGSMFDGNWLDSFDRNLDHHFRVHLSK